VNLGGKRVLLTGATGGLGRGIAKALAEKGATVVLSGRSREALEEFASELPGDHRVAPADLSEPGAAASLLEAAGDVDVLVANAALPGTGDLTDYTPTQIERLLRLNFEVPIEMAGRLLPEMRRRDSGHLVFIASLSGKLAAPRSSLYSATKFGLRGFALALREDLRPTGVGVSLVSPGAIAEAGMFADSGAKLPPGLGRLKTPADVGAAVVRAIEKNRSEVDVATRRARLGALTAMVMPELMGRLSYRQSLKVASAIEAGQTEKRPTAD
jgi:short-subunit dehydrogenase